jgi:pimeloyl-ACP methyl ester carboxylesterase
MALVVFASASCSDQRTVQFEYFRVTVDGQQTLGISAKDVMIRGIIIFFHGVGGDEFSLTVDQAHKDMTAALVNAGFAVVASRAGGDAWGNPASQQNYLRLAGMAADHYRTENVFFLAESMGAIAALNLFTKYETQRIRGLAAINPVLDLTEVAPQYQPTVDGLYPNEAAISANPMDLPLNALSGKKIRFYIRSDDAALDATTAEFQRKFGSVADISLIRCGQHDGSCFQGADILRWFSLLENRA